MSLKGFLAKYAGEVSAVATALTSVASGIALPRNEAETVQNVIDKLKAASDSIVASLPDVKEATVKIDKADIDAALARILPKMVEDAVAKALADKATK